MLSQPYAVKTITFGRYRERMNHESRSSKVIHESYICCQGTPESPDMLNMGGLKP